MEGRIDDTYTLPDRVIDIHGPHLVYRPVHSRPARLGIAWLEPYRSRKDSAKSDDQQVLGQNAPLGWIFLLFGTGFTEEVGSRKGRLRVLGVFRADERAERWHK